MLCATFLKSVPPQIRKKFIVATEFRASSYNSGSFVMDIIKLFFNISRTVIPYRVTILKRFCCCCCCFFSLPRSILVLSGRYHIMSNASIQYLTLYSVNMTYNLKKSIIQWESVCICICLYVHGVEVYLRSV